MAEIKTKQNDADVNAFIMNYAATEQKQKDSFKLIELMSDITGCEPKMWGETIIGFGTYHYKSERSRQEGDWLLIGFSPRKAAISLYVYTDSKENERLLNDLGKFKMGKGCIYVNKLSDINIEVLTKIINETIKVIRTKFKN